MTKDRREVQRKLRILRYAEETGHVARTCRYFGVGRSSFYRWRQAYADRGEAGLISTPHPKMACQPNTPREGREGAISSLQISSRTNADRLVFGTIP